MFAIKVLLKATMLTFLSAFVSAQNDGVCSCTPLVYNWKLDFSRTCSRSYVNIPTGKGTGIIEASCDIIDPNIVGPSVTDFKPISIVSYQIIELGLDLIPVKVDGQSNVTLSNESAIVFSSLTAAKHNVTSGGLQATLIALNTDQQRIELNWIVKYSNLCENLPYSVESSLGWMVFMANEPGKDPRTGTCFVESENPSLSPSVVPSSSTSQKPTVSNSNLPSAALSVSPSRPPTPAPSAFPSKKKQPTVLPTVNMPEVSTEVPSFDMSYSYSYDYSYSYSYGSYNYSDSNSYSNSYSYSYNHDLNRDRRASRNQNIYYNEFGHKKIKRKRTL